MLVARLRALTVGDKHTTSALFIDSLDPYRHGADAVARKLPWGLHGLFADEADRGGRGVLSKAVESRAARSGPAAEIEADHPGFERPVSRSAPIQARLGIPLSCN